MKKIIKSFMIIISLFFIGINSVFADNCAKINEKIELYDTYNEILSSLDCTDDSDIGNVSNCNDYNIKKNIVITELMKLKDNKNICSTYEQKVDEIIKENEDRCGQIFDSDFNKFVNNVMIIFYVLGPILLILFGSLDYAKATVSSERDALKKANKNFLKRLVATILLFVAPTITNIIISFNVSDKYLSGNAYTCNYNYIVFNKKYNITYVPRNNSSTSYKGINNIKIGGISSDKEAEELTKALSDMLNTKVHIGNKEYQNGPFAEWWTQPYNMLDPFQCTWWANGRASQYLSKNGTKYKKYPTQGGHGGQYYDINKKNKYFKYGDSPKPNSIISWTYGNYGHVAYVEGVTEDSIYISHAGSGKTWRGVEKIPINGDIGWSGYKLNGYIYLDSPEN